MTNPLKAVSFDLWDTLVDDDSDEPKRREKGLRSKPEERRHLLWESLNRQQEVPLGEVSAAFDAADDAFNQAWKEGAVTWEVSERIEVALAGLGRELPAEEKETLAAALGRMEVDIPPDPVAGIEGALKDLAGRYKLCVTSDTLVTPADGLRRILEGHGLKQYFSGFAFSDEVGHSKPHRAMFEAAAGQLGVELAEMVHVGDRGHNDIDGPKALGMKAVLFTAAREDDKDWDSADAVCERHADLPGIIDSLAGG
jgi:putative hydrolase of the HAD superfamily